ncbi:MucR family transcriptional regulator [Inquilinus limosus]|uniref:MucR family transcriptional regulator n=1 Tax=Inquilinus limosus TaxID=171674 RepID=A0A211ZV05_9PROT|nr:MucR family transcriptional regulator [Inquilinus limosus]OWJ69132.1 MucR family transcriptional regulator [Inquilinus limosus]
MNEVGIATSDITADETRRLTARIVSAHVANNSVAQTDLPTLIAQVFTALSGLGKAPEPAAARPEPAVPIRKSVTPDYLVCLEGGKKLKMLKRHLSSAYNMTPDQYRERWGLPADYPMVAPNYAQQHSSLAKSIGLGRRLQEAKPVETKPAAAVEPARKRRPRTKA